MVSVQERDRRAVFDTNVGLGSILPSQVSSLACITQQKHTRPQESTEDSHTPPWSPRATGRIWRHRQ